MCTETETVITRETVSNHQGKVRLTLGVKEVTERWDKYSMTKDRRAYREDDQTGHESEYVAPQRFRGMGIIIRATE
jgi:hypothetical protein